MLFMADYDSRRICIYIYGDGTFYHFYIVLDCFHRAASYDFSINNFFVRHSRLAHLQSRALVRQ